jgi:hypothetical protein
MTNADALAEMVADLGRQLDRVAGGDSGHAGDFAQLCRNLGGLGITVVLIGGHMSGTALLRNLPDSHWKLVVVPLDAPRVEQR